MMAQNNFQKIDGNQDFDWAFCLNRKLLDPIGVWPSDKRQGRLKSSLLPLMLMLVLCCYCCPTAYAFIQVRHELTLAIDNLLTAVASWIAAAKFFSLWYYRPVYQSLVKWARSDWHRRTEYWERRLMLKQARRGRLLTAISYLTMITHVSCFLVAPITDLNIRLINNITDPDPQKVLPASTYYPYEYYKSPYYELTCLSQVIAIPAAASTYSMVDNFFSVMVFHASGQCEIIAERMSRLFSGRDDRSFGDRVRELVEFHNYIAGFVSAIEKSFNTVILIHISGSILLICSVSYGCIKAFDGTPAPVHIIILAAAIFNLNEHIFVYCLTAEILTSNSSEIFDGIYYSIWYDLPANEARYVTLIMARSKYPLKLSAGKFVYLSLNSYIQVVKSTAGYISMLLAVS